MSETIELNEREASSIGNDEWGQIPAGTPVVMTSGKAADFRSFAAQQGITSVDAGGNLVLMFLRSEPGDIVQRYDFKGMHPQGTAELEIRKTEVSVSSVQACHVVMPTKDAAIFAAQMLGLLKRTNRALFDEVAPMTGIGQPNE